MTRSPVVRLAIELALAGVAGGAAAQWSGWDYDRDEPVRKPVELEVKPPAFPREANLLQFDAGGASPHRFYLDAESIAVGADAIVRYTLVVKTAGGATNVSFEGMRCDTRQFKVYALGRTEGVWMPARDAQWRRIEHLGVNQHHGALYGGVLCRERAPVKDAKEAIDAIKHGGR